MITARGALTRALAGAAIIGAATTAWAATASALPDGAAVSHGLDDTGVSIQVVGDIPATADPQSPYGLVVEVASTLVPVAGVTVELAVTDAPFETPGALGVFLESPRAVATHSVAAATPTSDGEQAPGTVRVGASATTSVAVAPGGLGLPADASGVYGVVVTVRAGSEVVWERSSALTWRPAALPQLDVTVVATVTGQEGRIDALLMAASDERVSLAVDPTSLSTEQLLGLTGRDAYALAAGGLDVTSAAHAEAPALIEAAVARSAGKLGLPWIAVAASPDDSTVGAASALGATAIVTDARWPSLEAPEGGGLYAPAPSASSAVMAPLVVPDEELSTLLASRSPADPTTSAGLVASAAFAAMDDRGAVVVSPGDGWVVDSTRASRAVDALLDAPFVTPRTLGEVLSDSGRTATDLPDRVDLAGDAPVQDVVAAVSALSRLDALDRATQSHSAMIDTARLGIFSALSVAERADATHRSESTAAALASATDVVSAVAVTSGSQLLLVSSSGSVPITVFNGLDVPVTVRVAVTSRSPILVSEGQPTVTIEPGAEATVKVPVTAVSSGDVDVSVAVRTEDGSTVAVAETLRVRVRAAWGNTATGVLTLGLAVLLVAGIIRTIRRGRKDTRLLPADDTAVAGSAPGSL